MSDKNVPAWPRLPVEVADVIEPHLDDLAREILATIAHEVPGYARPLEGSFGRGIRLGVNEALSRFVTLIRDPASDRGPGREVYVELGRGELRQGRSLDSLQSAYRVGARVAWQRLSRAGQAAGLEPDVLYALAEAIFAYIDELSAESVEGYAEARSASEGARERRRERLLEALLRSTPPDPEDLRRLADEAEWDPPKSAAVLVCAPGRERPIARMLDVDPIAGRVDGLGCLVLPDPEGPSAAERLRLACEAEPAAAGTTVELGSLAASLREARATWEAIDAGAIAVPARGGWPVRSDEHLVALVLHAGRERLGRVASRRLVALEAETEASRARLMETLDAHLRHGGRVAPVAAELHVHEQTVRYRVSRLRELLGEQLDEPDARFELEAALRARPG